MIIRKVPISEATKPYLIEPMITNRGKKITY